MREATFITEITKSLEDAGCLFVYKPPDNPASWTMSATRFTPAKPCDIITCDRDKMILIECKQLRKWEAFSERHMRPSQIKNLSIAHKMGHKAFVFLNVRIVSERTNYLLIFNWPKLCDIWASQKGCIRGDEIKSRCLSEQAIIGYKERFDVSSILDM